MARPEKIAFTVEFDGKTFHGEVDNGVIAAFEDDTDRSIAEVAGAPGRPPKLSLLGAFLAHALARHHPGLTRVDGMDMLSDPAVMAALMGGLADAMPREGDVEEAGESTGNPRPAKRVRKGGRKG